MSSTPVHPLATESLTPTRAVPSGAASARAAQERISDSSWGIPDEGQWAWLLRFERVWASFALDVARAGEWELLEEALRRARAMDWPGASSFSGTLFFTLRMSACEEPGVWTRFAEFLGEPSAGIDGGQPKIDGWWQCAGVLEDLLRSDLMQGHSSDTQNQRAWATLFAGAGARTAAAVIDEKKRASIAEKLVWSGEWDAQWEAIWGTPSTVLEDLAERILRPVQGWFQDELGPDGRSAGMDIEGMRRESGSLRTCAAVHPQWQARALQLHGALWCENGAREHENALWVQGLSRKAQGGQGEQLAIALALQEGWLTLPEPKNAVYWALNMAREALGWGPTRQPMWQAWLHLARDWALKADSMQPVQEWVCNLGPCETWPCVPGQQSPWGVMGWIANEKPCMGGTLQGWALAAAGRGWKNEAVDTLARMGIATTGEHARWARQFWELAARGNQLVAGRNFLAGCVPRSVVEALTQGAPFWERLEMEELLAASPDKESGKRRKARSL